MVYAVCPTDVVSAPVEIVWRLLTTPAGWGDFFDAEVLRVEPPGPAAVGQHVDLRSGPGIAKFRLQFDFVLVDAAQHVLGIEIRLPFGIVNHERLSCAPLGPETCRVSYGCNFEFPRGWLGWLLLTVLRREIEAGPVDSLARLKRTAEARWSATRA